MYLTAPPCVYVRMQEHRNREQIHRPITLNLKWVIFTEECRYIQILVKIGQQQQQQRTLYMKIYTGFCAHLERKELNK
jgi:hypothetical protein